MTVLATGSALTPLVEQLTERFGHVLPADLVASTVAAAWRDVPRHDEAAVRGAAEADVAALAEAVLRRSSAEDAVA